MKQSAIQKIRIDIQSNSESALSLLMDKQGMIKRQGNGVLPVEKAEVVTNTDGELFSQVISLIDENIMPFADVYDHPNKQGIPLVISVVFMQSKNKVKAFEFRLGSETQDVGDLFPFFDQFIAQSVKITQDWYDTARQVPNN